MMVTPGTTRTSAYNVFVAQSYRKYSLDSISLSVFPARYMLAKKSFARSHSPMFPSTFAAPYVGCGGAAIAEAGSGALASAVEDTANASGESPGLKTKPGSLAQFASVRGLASAVLRI